LRLYRGIRTLGRYRVRVLRGFDRGTPGVDESVAISRDDWPDAPVTASAILLGVDGLAIEKW